MTISSPIDRARTLLAANTKARAADIEQTIGDLERHAAEAEDRLDGLADDRDRALVNAGAAEVAAIDEKIRTERFRIEQSRAILFEVRANLERVVERDRLALQRSRREAVEALMKKAVAAQSELPRAAEAVRSIIAAVATADRAAEEFQRDFPEEPTIQRAEDRVRFTPESRKVLAETKELAWVFANGKVYAGDPVDVFDTRISDPHYRAAPRELAWNRNILDEIAAGEMKPDARLIFKMARGNGERVWPRLVLRREIEVHAASRPEALATAVKLPGLRVGEVGWDVDDTDAASVLAQLDAPPRSDLAPTIEVELIPLDEPAKVLQLTTSRAA